MITLDLNENLFVAYPTPMFRAEVPDAPRINPGLAAFLRGLRERFPAPSTCAVGGWQSPHGLGTGALSCPEIQALLPWIGSSVMALASVHFGEPVTDAEFGLRVDIWGNIAGSGNFTKVHHHSWTMWSGVYYVDAEGGDPAVPENGAIEFVDARNVQEVRQVGRLSRRRENLVIEPRDGLLIAWPSWVKHSTYPFLAAPGGERVALAFNADLVPWSDGEGRDAGPAA